MDARKKTRSLPSLNQAKPLILNYIPVSRILNVYGETEAEWNKDHCNANHRDIPSIYKVNWKFE